MDDKGQPLLRQDKVAAPAEVAERVGCDFRRARPREAGETGWRRTGQAGAGRDRLVQGEADWRRTGETGAGRDRLAQDEADWCRTKQTGAGRLPRPIDTTRQRHDHAIKLHLKEEGRELLYRDAAAACQ